MTRDFDYEDTYYSGVSATENDRRRKGFPLHDNHDLDFQKVWPPDKPTWRMRASQEGLLQHTVPLEASNH